MFHKRSFFKSPVFNVLATALLILALAVFYKFALADYMTTLRVDVNDLDLSRLEQVKDTPKTLDEALEAIGENEAIREINEDLLTYCHDNIREDIYDRICEYIEANGAYSDKMWEELCGYTLLALYDISSGAVNAYNYSVKDTGDALTLAFAGDVSLDTTAKHWWSPLVVHAANRGNLLESAFPGELSEKMIGADVFCINLESPFVSAEAKPIDNKWRHGASAENVNILGVLGADLVNIANTRIFDFGARGFSDTLTALDSADIDYIGGGRNLEDAKTPRYIIACGRKIAIVSAMQTKLETTPPEAAAKSAGVIYTTNSAYFNAMIADAKANADYVIVYTDWADGNGENPDATQTALAHSFVDAGADIVIGTKSTTMQAVEYYMEKPIVYGLGNFWYETDHHENILLEIKFEKNTVYTASEEDENTIDEALTRYSIDPEPKLFCTPCIQDKATVRSVLGSDEGNAIIAKLNSLSGGTAVIGEDGSITASSSETIE